ncbi:class I SAM-dependent methyltransferase [Virgibacillus oceani]
MPIDFHDERNENSYNSRSADEDWKDIMKSLTEEIAINKAADIGIGGGIYSKALLDMGVPFVTGVDFSASMIKGAKKNLEKYDGQVHFKIGNAYNIGLPDNSHNLVLERALIHHLEDLQACLMEAYRVLHENGVIIIQDRTPSDCFLEGDKRHIRGFIFELFPNLKEIEQRRRFSSHEVRKQLERVGFKNVKAIKFWETRRKYNSKADLLHEIETRKGRSILFELSDAELQELISYIDRKFSHEEAIVEKDRWTIWKAMK